MRRMDSLTNERIIEIMRAAAHAHCARCVMVGPDLTCRGLPSDSCTASAIKWLEEPLPEKSLWQTITSDGDLMRLMEEFKKICEAHLDCEKCEMNGSGGDSDGYTSDCFGFFLLQKVPRDE